MYFVLAKWHPKTKGFLLLGKNGLHLYNTFYMKEKLNFKWLKMLRKCKWNSYCYELSDLNTIK